MIDLETLQTIFFVFIFLSLVLYRRVQQVYSSTCLYGCHSYDEAWFVRIIFVMDESDCIFPIVFWFAPKESNATLTWFLERLHRAIGFRDNIVLVTDRIKSIPQAVHFVYPNVPHAACYFHLKNNLIKYFSKMNDVEKAFAASIYTHSRSKCARLLDGIKNSCPNLQRELVAIDIWLPFYC